MHKTNKPVEWAWTNFLYSSPSSSTGQLGRAKSPCDFLFSLESLAVSECLFIRVSVLVTNAILFSLGLIFNRIYTREKVQSRRHRSRLCLSHFKSLGRRQVPTSASASAPASTSTSSTSSPSEECICPGALDMHSHLNFALTLTLACSLPRERSKGDLARLKLWLIHLFRVIMELDLVLCRWVVTEFPPGAG